MPWQRFRFTAVRSAVFEGCVDSDEMVLHVTTSDRYAVTVIKTFCLLGGLCCSPTWVFLHVCARTFISGLVPRMCSAGAMRCRFIWFNEILTKLSKARDNLPFRARATQSCKYRIAVCLLSIIQNSIHKHTLREYTRKFLCQRSLLDGAF